MAYRSVLYGVKFLKVPCTLSQRTIVSVVEINRTTYRRVISIYLVLFGEQIDGLRYGGGLIV